MVHIVGKPINPLEAAAHSDPDAASNDMLMSCLLMNFLVDLGANPPNRLKHEFLNKTF